MGSRVSCKCGEGYSIPGQQMKSMSYRNCTIVRTGLLCVGIAAYCIFLTSVVSCAKPLTENEEVGKELYDIHCSECHDENQSGLKKVPPKLHDLFAHNMLPDGTSPATGEAVRQVIIHGKRTMPAFNGRLTEGQVEDLVAYLHRK